MNRFLFFGYTFRKAALWKFQKFLHIDPSPALVGSWCVKLITVEFQLLFCVLICIIRVFFQKQSHGSGNDRGCHGSAAFHSVAVMETAGIDIGSRSDDIRLHNTGTGRSSSGIMTWKSAVSPDLQGVIAGAHGNDLMTVAWD